LRLRWPSLLSQPHRDQILSASGNRPHPCQQIESKRPFTISYASLHASISSSTHPQVTLALPASRGRRPSEGVERKLRDIDALAITKPAWRNQSPGAPIKADHSRIGPQAADQLPQRRLQAVRSARWDQGGDRTAEGRPRRTMRLFQGGWSRQVDTICRRTHPLMQAASAAERSGAARRPHSAGEHTSTRPRNAAIQGASAR